MVNVLVTVGVSLICLAALLNVLALSLNFWEKREFTSTSSNNSRKHTERQKGLCTTENDTTGYECLDYEPNTDTTEGVKVVLVRAVLFSSIFLLTASLVCIILKLCVVQEKRFFIHISWILSLAAGLMSLIASSVYRSLKNPCNDYMVAFYLAILGWLVAWAACVLVFAASRKDDQGGILQYTVLK